MNKIRVASVSYLNAKPLLYGIAIHPVSQQIDLTLDYPAKIAQWLIDDQVDIGLVPVAALLRIPDAQIITDYCIGAEGAVASVCIFSEVPIEQITHVYLDYQSRTSVALAKVLLREYWKKNVVLIDASGEDYRNKINGTVAGVVIGDRALEQRTKSSFIYDLAEAWKNHTGLPFVFAAWVANKLISSEFINAFNEANYLGLQHRNEVAQEQHFSLFDLKIYYNNCISYELTDMKRKGLQLFLEKVEGL